MQTDLPCFYSDLPGTRARRLCFGRTTSFSGRRSRECGFVDDVALCLEHYRIAKGTSNKCCVLFDSARCRGSLRACPERLFAVLDDIVGQPAAFLCRSHLETIDSMEQVTAHPLYRPPAKRSAIESQAENLPEAEEPGAGTQRESENLLETMQEQLFAASVQLQQLMFERDAFQEEAAAAKSYLATLKHDVTNLTSNLEMAEAENDRLTSQLTAASNEASTLKIENEKLKKESFPELIKSFQEAYRLHVPERGKLYNADEMESFCETNSPGLFNIIEKSIKSHYSATVDSERRTGLRRSRVVGELHRLAYLRNQQNTTFASDVGLHLSLSGCSEAALECGRRLGICDHPTTIHRRKLSSANRPLGTFSRCYVTPNQKDLDSLKSCCLLSEQEQQLKSLRNYKDVIENVLELYPALKMYLSQCILPAAGDYPTFYFLKKLIAQICTNIYLGEGKCYHENQDSTEWQR
ncbi:uncharacterized protein [Oscarella lobularis]|uniref:uncharacterized protein n=1 Tax=Oscarella lobularis TaxID=121494 RepID=UPI0033142846